MSIDNLRELWDKRDAIDMREGVMAYSRYNDVMAMFGQHYGFTIEATTSAFVALSPNNDYHGNLRSLSSVMEGVKLGLEPEQVTVSTYKACRDRAMSYLTGEVDFLSTVKGPKIRAFRDNILNPATSNEVTVDGHMVGAWLAKNFTMKQAAGWLRTNTQYEEVADGIRDLADENRLVPCAMQAVLWMTRKRLQTVKYDPQLSFFHSNDDVWRTLCRPEDYPPYWSKVNVTV